MGVRVYHLEQCNVFDSKAPLRILARVLLIIILLSTFITLLALGFTVLDLKPFYDIWLISLTLLVFFLSLRIAFKVLRRIPMAVPLEIKVSESQISLKRSGQEWINILNHDLREFCWWSTSLHFTDSLKNKWKIPVYYMTRGHGQLNFTDQAFTNFFGGKFKLVVANRQLQVTSVPIKSIPFLDRFLNRALPFDE